MTLKTRLQVLLLLSLVTLVGFGGLFTKSQFSAYRTASKTPGYLGYCEFLGDLTHELQKERGLSAGFLSSGGSKFSSELIGQRRQTDDVIAEMSDRLSEVNADGLITARQVDELTKNAVSLRSLRQAVDSMQSPSEILPLYTSLIQYNLSETGWVSKALSGADLTKTLIADQSLANAKEFAGLERAKVAQALAKGEADVPLRFAIISLRRAQEEHLVIARGLFGKRFDSVLDEIETSPESRAASAISHHVTKSDGEPLTKYTASDWWKAQTAKLGCYRRAQSTVASSVAEEAQIAGSAALKMVWLVAAVVVIAATFVSWFGVSTIRSLSDRTRELVEAIRRIAEGEANLSERLDESKDEMGQISATFNRVMDRLQEAGDLCGENSDSLAAQGSQVSQSASQIAEQIKDSQSQSHEVTTDASHMSTDLQDASRMITDVTQSLGDASTTIADLATDMEQANQIASGASDQSERASVVVNQNAERIGELAGAAREIGNVVELIQDIAEQTNLLSLNATIEAARAGESGKGFAVVASEVKDLARQTAQAIDSIRDRVESIQTASDAANESIAEIGNAFSDLSRSASELAEQTTQHRETANRLNGDIRGLSESSLTACQAMDRTVSRTQSITDRLKFIDNALLASAEGVDETHRAGIELSDTAKSMRDQMSTILSCSN
ncbi:MAG: methyl-accepting chemotaxis protein [Planctomycetota bacterium]